MWTIPGGWEGVRGVDFFVRKAFKIITLTFVCHAEILQSKILNILLQLQHLRSTINLLNKALNALQIGAVFGGNVVVDGYEGAVGAADGTGGEEETFEGLGGGYFVDEVAVDVEEGGAVGFGDLWGVGVWGVKGG